MTSMARALRFVDRALRDFEAGVFADLEPIPWEQDSSGVFQFPGYDFLPGPVGGLYRGMIEIEWHPPFDWAPLEDLAEALDDDPCQAADLNGETLCQLLVGHGRAERFCDGLFLKRVHSGQMRALLARVKVLAADRAGSVADLHVVSRALPRRCRSKPKRCKACRSSRIAYILHGMPAMDAQMERDIQEGRLVLGGCCVTEDDAEWQCTTCGTPVHVTGREQEAGPRWER